jgi:hypothetical protein
VFVALCVILIGAQIYVRIRGTKSIAVPIGYKPVEGGEQRSSPTPAE